MLQIILSTTVHAHVYSQCYSFSHRLDTFISVCLNWSYARFSHTCLVDVGALRHYVQVHHIRDCPTFPRAADNAGEVLHNILLAGHN